MIVSSQFAVGLREGLGGHVFGMDGFCKGVIAKDPGELGRAYHVRGSNDDVF
jgi:hypothetical protein